MAAVVPAWRLTDLLLNDPKVVAMRDEGEREWLEENPEPPAGVPDVAEKPDEWDRDDFMRDLERATQPTEPGDKSQPGKA